MDQRNDFIEEYTKYYNYLINNVHNLRYMDPQLRELMLKLLVIDPTYRIPWDDYFNNPFFNDKKKG